MIFGGAAFGSMEYAATREGAANAFGVGISRGRDTLSGINVGVNSLIVGRNTLSGVNVGVSSISSR